MFINSYKKHIKNIGDIASRKNRAALGIQSVPELIDEEKFSCFFPLMKLLQWNSLSQRYRLKKHCPDERKLRTLISIGKHKQY